MSTLMLRDREVIQFKDACNAPVEIEKIINPEFLPIIMQGSPTMERFNIWFKKYRSIPSGPQGREGFELLKEKFGDKWTVSPNYASLSDQYWIRMRGEKWKDVNFFNKHYSPDIGDMTFQPWEIKPSHISANSPDLTTIGKLRKAWRQNRDYTSRLVKASSYAARQEPLSEVLVSVLTERMGKIQSAKYDLCIEGIEMCSTCPNFITIDTELVPATAFLYMQKSNEGESTYHYLLRMTEQLDIPDAEEYINWTMFIDSLTGNSDRNLGNIGFIRNINSLKFVGPAPLYDCGSAYWSTTKVGSAVRSMASDAELSTILKRLRGQLNLSFMEDANKDFANLIYAYPEISEKKKVNLVKAIKERNERLLNVERGEIAR